MLIFRKEVVSKSILFGTKENMVKTVLKSMDKEFLEKHYESIDFETLAENFDKLSANVLRKLTRYNNKSIIYYVYLCIIRHKK